MKRSGFSLVEALIAIALVLAVSAIAWPALSGYAREQTLRETAYRMTRELDAQLYDAERRGVAVAVFLEAPAVGNARLVAHRLTRETLVPVIVSRSEDAEAGGDGPGAGFADDRGTDPGLGDDDEESVARTLMTLPPRVVVRRPGDLQRDDAVMEMRPERGGGFGGGEMMLLADMDAPMFDPEPVDRRWLVAVYLPDGTAVPGTGVELALGRLPAVRVVVEPGLGKARAREAPRGGAIEEGMDEAFGAGADENAGGPPARSAAGGDARGGR